MGHPACRSGWARLSPGRSAPLTPEQATGVARSLLRLDRLVSALVAAASGGHVAMAGASTFVLAWPAPLGWRAGVVLAAEGALAAGASCGGAAGWATCAVRT